MATSNKDDLEDLFREALGDFMQQGPTAHCANSGAIAQQPVSPGNKADSDAVATPPQPPTATVSTSQQPTGLGKGLGLGTALPGRGPKLPPPKQTNRAAPNDNVATEQSSSTQPASTLDSNTQPAAPKLPPHMQALADDIMGLLRDAGTGGEGGGDADDGGMDDELKAMQALLMNQFRMSGGDPGEMMGMPSTSGGTSWDGLGAMGTGEGSGVEGGEEEDRTEAVASDAVRGLMQRTKKTVEKQAKFARGEGAARAGWPGAAGSGLGGGGAAGNPFADLLGGLGGLDGGGGGDNQDFLTNMIFKHMLLSKDMLYGPLKDIHGKYPPWIAAHRDALTPEELTRYQSQQTSIEAVLAQYDKNPDDTTKIMELVAEMQSYGQPPDDLVAEFSSDLGGDMAATEETRGEGGPTDEDFNFEGLPPELLQNLPKELQKDCTIM